MRATLAAAASLASLLAGCASLPAPDAAPALEGRLAVQIEGQPERGFSAGFELRGHADAGRLDLNGPLGARAAQARWDRDGVVLDSGGQTRRFADLDDLAREALGESLPLAALFDWLRGQPWPARPHAARSDGGAGFEQLGWRIDTSGQGEGRLVAQRLAPPTVTVRVRLEAPG
ncbi:MAG: outer membrane lipoprotein LolB [Burkholderiaceae bacterium]|nr:outer membrane lipoprotein LolB [Burkholderiaceae bacterium]